MSESTVSEDRAETIFTIPVKCSVDVAQREEIQSVLALEESALQNNPKNVSNLIKPETLVVRILVFRNPPNSQSWRVGQTS